MRIKSLKIFASSCALVLALAAPAAAQGQLGAGVSFLHDEETGTGFTVDYSRVFRPMEPGNLGWVADLSLHNFDGGRVTSIMGGVRYGRPANERVDWFGQALIGIARSSPTGDLADLCEELEDEFDEDLGCSSTDLAFAPGVGINVALTPRVNFRAQFDLMFIATPEESTTATRFWFGVSFPIGNTAP